MKVFISWSGERSNYVARALYEWIPRVIQNVEPWLSEEMPKGVRWSPEIAKALDETKFGVFCVTPENQGQPWLNFEAGALSKTITERAYVCAFLIELRPIDLVGPLKEFQMTNPDRQDTFRLIKTMNEAQGDRALSDKLLEDSFALWWPHLEEKLNQLPEPETSVPKERDPREIQEETLETVRRTEKSVMILSESFRLLGLDLRSATSGIGEIQSEDAVGSKGILKRKMTAGRPSSLSETEQGQLRNLMEALEALMTHLSQLSQVTKEATDK